MNNKYKSSNFSLRRVVCFVLLITFFSCSPDNSNKKIFPGYLEGEFVYISAPFAGMINNIYVKRGDSVKAGQVVFALDKTEKESELEFYNFVLSASLSIAKDLQKGMQEPYVRAAVADIGSITALKKWYAINSKRYEWLSSIKAEPKTTHEMYKYNFEKYSKDLEKAIANLDIANLPEREDRIFAAIAFSKAIREKINKARWDLSQMTQYAPQLAFVFDAIYHKGEYASAGQPVVILLPPENIKARFFVNGDVLNKLKIGQKVFVNVLGRKDIPAQINYISQKVEYTPPVIYSEQNRDKLVYMVEANIAPDVAKSLPVGQPIQVSILF